MDLKPFSNVSLELALNSRVSTGGNPTVRHFGTQDKGPIRPEQIEFIFWCLGRTPRIAEVNPTIQYLGETFDPQTFTLGGTVIDFPPAEYLRLHWANADGREKIDFSNASENAYWLEQGMGQEMVHIAGAIAQVGVCMIGGVYVDLVPMVPYLSSEPPKGHRIGNLPDPKRDSEVLAVDCISNLRIANAFMPGALTPSQLGQLLWAGCGSTPHETYRYYQTNTPDFVGQGKTIPSAAATYTVSLHVVEEDNVSEYVSWNQESGKPTHSRRRIAEGGFIEKLRRDLPGLPGASTYIVISSMGRRNPFFSMMEAGYAMLHILLQSYAVGTESGIVVMSGDQMKRIQHILSLKDTPIVVVPTGRGA